MNRASTTKGRKDSIEMVRGGRDTILPKITHCTFNDPQSRSLSKIWKFSLSEGFVYWAPKTLRSWMRERSPLNARLLKTNRDYIQENHGTIGNGELALKGSCADSLTQGHSTKTPICKAPRPDVKKIHLLILKCFPERQETFELFPGMETLAGGTLVTLSSLLKLVRVGVIWELFL